jgi:hypothetical protein
MYEECVTGIYDSLAKAEEAVHILHRAGFPAGQISLVAAGLEGKPEIVKELSRGDDSAHDAAIGAGLGGVLGLLGGVTIATVLGLSAVFLVGPIGGAVVGSAVGAFLGGMGGWGVHEQQIRHYEACVKNGKVLVILNGNPLELDQADRILKETDVAEVHMHVRNSSDAPEVSR